MTKTIRTGHRAYHFRYLLFISLQLLLMIAGTGSAYARHHFRDTVRFRRSVAEKSKLVLSDSSLEAIGIDSLLNKIENVHNTLDRINNTNAIGYDTRDIVTNMPEIDSNVDLIDESLTLYNHVLDVKNLQMFDILLTNLQEQLTDWRTTLFKYNQELLGMQAEMNAFKKDTILRALIADSAFRSLYQNEITDLRTKWDTAKIEVKYNLEHLNQLQATVSSLFFETIDLQNKSKSLLRKISIKSLGKEYDYLWDMRHNEASEIAEQDQLAQKAYGGQRKILHYYFKRNANSQYWLLFTGVLFFLWVFRNFKKAEKDKETLPVFSYIKKFPLPATLVVLFNISSFFDLHPPTAYIETMEFLLVVTLTFILWNTWSRRLFYFWLAIGALYITFSFAGALLTPAPGFRILLLLLSLVSAVFGIFWLRTLKKITLAFSAMIKVASIIYIALNLAAVLCNLFGRLSLAKIFSVTAIFGLTQIIGLSVFIEIVVEAFNLQANVVKQRGGLYAKLNFERLQKSLILALMIVAVIIWSVVFSISLNIYNFLFDQLGTLLASPRKIGSTSFQIGNIALFIVIIYISAILQQIIGSLYDKTESAWDPDIKKNSSRLAMTRLIVIVIGFMIAVAASGLPIDKITIVLGALGVGIGLGLQSIVNNLVSGVILIFEQPFRIGDYIEIGDKKGRVLNIGIRSSKLIMEEGAEIILPNADMLSGSVINWTLRNENMRVTLPISVEATHTFEEVQKLIVDELSKDENVVSTIASEVLLVSLTDKAMNLNVLVWINDVNKAASIKSKLLKDIYGGLTKSGIKVI